MLKKQLFATKSLGVLADELAGEHRLRRVLGPVTLTSLGIGAVIGAGIFVATGEAARNTAGPALMLSYVVAGLTCVFAALCYAEFASMAPVAGSAHTYAYTTLGELLAWIIGWDLVLEYAVGASTVANGWSSYFQAVLAQFHIVLPETLRGAAVVYNRNTGAFEATGSFINLPAVLVVAVITAVLVKGIRESAGFNAVMVGIKVTAVLMMRRMNPNADRPFRCPLVPLTPILGIASCLVLMFSLPAANWWRLFAWLGIGLVIYFTYGRHHSHVGQQLRREIVSHGVSPAGSISDSTKP